VAVFSRASKLAEVVARCLVRSARPETEGKGWGATGHTVSCHNPTERSGGFKLRRAIAAHVAQESSRQDHTAAPLPDDRGTYVRATTRIAIKRVKELKRGKGERSNVAVCNASVCVRKRQSAVGGLQ